MTGVFGSVAAFLATRYGGLCREAETVVTVGAAAVRLAGNDSERVCLVLCNNGAADVRVALTQGVTVTRGIRVPGGGGVVAMDIDHDAHLPSLEWWAISGAAGNDVYVLTVRRDTALPREDV